MSLTNHVDDSDQLQNTHDEEMENRDESASVDSNDDGMTGMLNGNAVDNEVSMNPDDDMDDDDSRAEATYTYTIHNISKLKETQLSPPVMVRNLPWKIMAIPRAQHAHQKTLGFFLQCNGESDSTSWSCNASADLTIVSHTPNGADLTRKIQHLFYSKENDWGFSTFISMQDLCDPEKSFVQNDSVTLQVHVCADAPHGVSWDSRKHTGFIGLKNQGATCYMNSILQTLFFTNKLRKAVYMLPTDGDDNSKSIPLALQRVFHELQFSDKPVGTKKLTKSFGWESLDTFMQHDVQELCRVLLDNIESKMKDTCVEGTIPFIFKGKTVSYIKCKHVKYASEKTEAFYDIQLSVKGKRSIVEAFQDYIKTEDLDGDNKYDAGEYGLQDAEKGVRFISFPPVLHLHLLRFMYDPVSDTNIKINDRYEFPERLNLDQFLQHKEKTPATYVLQAVLVHSGDNHGGHYVVYINPKGDGKWCKFDDDVVSRCSRVEATEYNYGSNDEEISVRQCTNAYMLVYTRESDMTKLLQTIADQDIPESLKNRLAEERRQEALKRKERLEAHLYMTVNVLLEDAFCGYQGNDLYDPDKSNYITFKVMKSSTLQQVCETLAHNLNYSLDTIRPWPLHLRENGTRRPTALDLDNDIDKKISEVTDPEQVFTVFVETVAPDSPTASLPPFNKENDVLLFLKLYDPASASTTYCGHLYVPISESVASLLPLMRQKANFAPNTPLMLFEEVKPNMLERINVLNQPLEKALEELMDGDILVFQKEISDLNAFEMPTPREYFKDLYYRIEVLFCDKSVANDPGVAIPLSLKNNYHQMATAVAQQLNTDPYLIQFFKPQAYREGPGNAIKCTYEGILKDIFVNYGRSRQLRKLYYNLLTIRIDELENKRQFKCTWVNCKLKEEKELVLYPNKSGFISDILDEAHKQVELSPVEGSGKLRLLEVTGSKIVALHPEDLSLDGLTATGAKSFRIEEIPKVQQAVATDEIIVPVAHFQKDVYTSFGIPFLLKLKEGESFSSVKDRIQKKLDVPEKEYEKFKFCVVCMGRPEYLADDQPDFKISISKFSTPSVTGGPVPWLGLDHINKTPKRSRINYYEKAIKIFN